MSRSTRAVATLTAAQALGLSGAPLVVMVGSIVGQELAPSPALGTLPLATTVVGTALGSAPAALAMQRLGRRSGFTLGALLGLAASVLAAFAIAEGGFALFSVATFLLGGSLSFVQQYRFAAAELGGPDGAGRAVSWVLAGGILAGVLGPEVGRRGRDLLATPYAGSFLVAAAVYALLAVVLLVGLEAGGLLPRGSDGTGGTEGSGHRATVGWPAVRGTRHLIADPSLLLPLGAGVTAFAVMTLVMTATPPAMHGLGHDVDATAVVIQAHVVAMYAPSLVSGALVARVGVDRLMGAGVVTLLASLALSLSGDGLAIWLGALVLLGLGWNLLFLSATVALAGAFPGADRFRAQALNDGLVFGAQAIASLGAGLLLAAGGWRAVSAVALLPLGAMTAVLATRRVAGARAGRLRSD